MTKTKNRLQALAMYLLQATTVSFIMLFATASYSQIILDTNSCSSQSGSSPILQTSRCKSASNQTTRNYTVANRLEAIGEPAGWKHKYRSILVGAKINGKGDFGVLSFQTPDPTNPSNREYYFDPNLPGSRLGIDEDGDCEYEREDEFLNWCQEQEIDEIVEKERISDPEPEERDPNLTSRGTRNR